MAEQFIRITDKTGQPLQEKPLDLNEVKATLAATNGQTYWRSLEELAAKPGFDEMLKREFPGQAPKDWAPLPRREFVRLMGAALALAGLSGCAFQPQEKIVPYVNQPEEIVPGIPLFYATAMPFMGYAMGLLAESHEGRPTKVEGNPDHPSSTMNNGRGATNAFAQASVLDMYDPDRSQTMRHGAGSTNWEDLNGAIQRALVASGDGTGVAILTGAITSPTLLGQLSRIQTRYPGLKWHTYEAINQDNARAGVRAAFGRDLHPLYHFDRADVIVSLDCNFLLEEPGHVQYARDFVSRRRVTNQVAEDANGNPEIVENAPGINRLYVVESTPTITGAKADHRFPVAASAVETVARQLASAVGVAGVSGAADEWVQTIARDLESKRGRVLVVAGHQQPAAVHALAHAITARLGSVGATGTISYHAPIEAAPTGALSHQDSLADLVQGLNSGATKSLFILGGNPVYDAPADLKFGEALAKAAAVNDAMVLHYGLHENETSVLCNWHVPEAHYLEYWGDARSVDGSLALIQPLIQPLYEAAKAPSEMLAAIAGQANVTSHDLLLDYHVRRRVTGISDPNVPAYQQLNDAQRLTFDRFWTKAVHDGRVDGFTAPVIGVSLSTGSLSTALAANNGTPIGNPLSKEVTAKDPLEVNFRPDPTIWDGRFANNAWLQELPKSITSTVWDNAIFVSPTTAHARGWRTNQEVELEVNGGKVKGAIVLLPGQPNNSLTVHLGYGRTTVGKIGTGAGFNANLIRSSKSPWFSGGVKVTPTGGVYKVAVTAQHNVIAPAGKEAGWGHAFNPLAPAANNQTKVVDNVLSPDSRHIDMDGTHNRDLVRSGTWAQLVEKIAPVSIKDKRGLPLAYPDNPFAIQKKVAKAINEHHGAEGEHHEPTERPKGSVELNKENVYGQPRGRSLEGYVSFYPRNNDPHALKPYRDESVNAEAEAKAKKDGRDDYTYAWGMTIDLQTCIGCNACVAACQSENNIAVVGKDQILMGRGMHWLRIDAYYRGDFENPEIHFEPMTCQHCEKAPCAPVCPFNAVMNSTEGINEQVYNRCVGTKYCENNCPYKVRRFNFLQYSDQQTPVIQLMQNPDVTVRSRGVMEKCTYCIQRVNYAKFQAKKEDRRVRDGEIITGCQQACPTNAIEFGDINDPKSKVSQLKRGPLTFGLLTELDTMPRTSYLAKFSNPNPAMKGFQPEPLLGPNASGGHADESGEGHAAGGPHGAEPGAAGHGAASGAEHAPAANHAPAPAH